MFYPIFSFVWIRIRIPNTDSDPEGSNTDPDPQHWPVQEYSYLPHIFFLVLFDNLVTCFSLSGSCGAPSTKEGLRRNLRVQTRKRTVLPGFSCGIRIRSNFHPNYVSGSWAFLIFLHSDQTRFSHLS